MTGWWAETSPLSETGIGHLHARVNTLSWINMVTRLIWAAGERHLQINEMELSFCSIVEDNHLLSSLINQGHLFLSPHKTPFFSQMNYTGLLSALKVSRYPVLNVPINSFFHTVTRKIFLWLGFDTNLQLGNSHCLTINKRILVF